MFCFLFPGPLRSESLEKESGFTKLAGSDKEVHPSGQALGIVMGRRGVEQQAPMLASADAVA